MIDGVVWDVGGVFYLTPFEVFPTLEAERGLPPGTLPRGPFGTRPDPDYEAVRAGEMDEPEYYLRRQSELRAAGIDLDLYADVDWRDKLRPEVLEAVGALRHRVRQVALTNDSSKWLGVGWWEEWPYRDLVDGIIDVVTIGVRKPDPKPYLLAADRIAVPPESCLFIDDLPVNCRGAEAVGMQSLLFDVTDPRESLDRLRHRLISP